MITIRFNPGRIIPDFWEYGKILAAALFLIFIARGFLYTAFPWVLELNSFWVLVLFILLVTWIKDLFEVKMGRKEYF